MKWWLLRSIARWCGLKVGMTAERDRVLVLMILSRDDASTLEAIELLKQTVTDHDDRKHVEWTH